MSQAEALLNSLTDEQIAAYSVDPNSEPHIVVGSDRFIIIPEKLRRIAVQYDHDVETVIFDCPRYWDNLDMSKMAIYINYMRSDKYTDSYPVSDITVEGDIMHFSWTISRNVTEKAGQISFLICIKKTDTDGNEVNHWNSELCQDMYISAGMETEEQPMDMYPDIVTELLLRMGKVEEIAVTKAQVDEALDRAETAAANAEDAQTNVEESAAEIRNSYANAVKKFKSGEVITANDVSPLEHNVEVKVVSKNLIPYPYSDTTKEVNGITFTDNGDGSITANGTATGNAVFYFINYGDNFLVNGTVCISGCPEGGSFTGTGYSLRLNKYVDGVETSGIVDTGAGRSVEMNNQIRLYFVVLSGTTVENLTFWPMMEYGDTPSEYIPYVDPTNVTVTSCGKNMLELSGNKSQNGVTMTVSDSGLVTVKGTTTASINLNVGKGFMKAGYKYKPIITFTKGDTYPSYWNLTTQSNMNKDSNGYLSSDVDTEFSAFIYAANAGVSYDSSFKLMVKLVDDKFDDSFEPFVLAEFCQPEGNDGECTVKSVSPNMTIFTDNPGVTIEAEYNQDQHKVLGDISAALDYILEIQDSILGGMS